MTKEKETQYCHGHCTSRIRGRLVSVSMLTDDGLHPRTEASWLDQYIRGCYSSLAEDQPHSRVRSTALHIFQECVVILAIVFAHIAITKAQENGCTICYGARARRVIRIVELDILA